MSAHSDTICVIDYVSIVRKFLSMYKFCITTIGVAAGARRANRAAEGLAAT